MWLGEIDYSQGFMSQKSIGVRQLLPFEKVDPGRIEPFDHYKELAKQHLVATVEGYRKYSKSYVDH